MRTNIDRDIFTIAGVLTRDECQELINWSESLGYEAAPVSLAAGQVIRPDIRNNARVMVDSLERAHDIWMRISAEVPPVLEGRRENASITPEPGLALIFNHYLLHEGAQVVEGQKYVLRTDVMYGRPGSGDSGG